MSINIHLLREYVRSIINEDKRGAMVRLGLPPEIINAIHAKPYGPKYGDWVAKTFAENSETTKIIDLYKKEASYENELLKQWKQLEPVYDKIFAWVYGKKISGGYDPKDKTFDQVLEDQELDNQVTKDEALGQVIMTFPDGYYWINLGSGKCDYEAKKMGHCGKDDRGNLWSLRDKNKNSHITATVDRSGIIHQLKGKENTKPIAKYYKYIVQLLASSKIIDLGELDSNDLQLSDFSPSSIKWLEQNAESSKIKTKAAEALRSSELLETMKTTKNICEVLATSIRDTFKKRGYDTTKFSYEIFTKDSKEIAPNAFNAFGEIPDGISVLLIYPEMTSKIGRFDTLPIEKLVARAGYNIERDGSGLVFKESYGFDDEKIYSISGTLKYYISKVENT